MSDKLTRIAIVSTDKCKPKKCRQECRKSCPVVRMGEWFQMSSSLRVRLLNGPLRPSHAYICVRVHAWKRDS